jgi:hypothetical protein
LLNAGIISLIFEDKKLNMHFNGNLKFYIKEVKKAIINSKNRDIINKDIYEYNKDDIVNHEDKIKANEVVGTLLSIKNLKQQIVKYFLLLHQFIIII